MCAPVVSAELKVPTPYAHAAAQPPVMPGDGLAAPTAPGQACLASVAFRALAPALAAYP